jgi:hypothetical protein
MTPGSGWVPDDKFLDRVKRSYCVASAKFRRSRWSQWFHIERLQQDVHSALMSESNDALRAIFSNPGASNLFFGVDNLCKHVSADDAGAGVYERDCLLQVAAAVGLKTDNPETALDGLDRRLGARIEFINPFRGEVGVETSRGVATYRAIQALYQAMRIRDRTPQDAQKVLEIGAGLGRTALYSFKSGLKEYTTIDLPMGVVSQACFLGAVLGPDRIWMTGDETDARDRIRLLSCTDLPSLRENFDLAFNADSIVEMGPLQALRYGAFIRRHAREFLSINHTDARIKVWQIALLSFPNRKKTRRDYPIRAGYFEELFV